MHKIRTGVDTIVLIAMATGESRSLDACRKLINIGHSLLVPSTVLQECEIMCRSTRPADQAIGMKIVERMEKPWGLIAAPATDPVNHGIALHIAREIELKFTLDSSYEENHGLVVADCGLLGCSRLLTWSPPLLGVPRTKLSLFLESRDVKGVQILTPDEAIAALCPES